MSQEIIEILHPGDEPLLESYLKPRLASSMFLLNNMRKAGLEDYGQRYGGTYAAYIQGGSITGVVAHYWNGMLVLQANHHLDRLIGAVTRASGRAVSGLVGLREQVKLAEAFLQVDPARVRLSEIEGLYLLDIGKMRVPDDLASGEWIARRIKPQDKDLITKWRIGYNLEALNEKDSPILRKKISADIERAIVDGTSWILEIDGRPVSSTSFNASINEAVQVGGVWTPSEFRRRGYARAAVAASLLDAKAEGVEKAILFTGDDNLPAIKAYKGLGFQRIGDFQLVLLYNH
jgi:GNAT superfamily N-acetyltransferase